MLASLRYSGLVIFFCLWIYACSKGRAGENTIVRPGDTLMVTTLLSKSDTISWEQPDSAIAIARRAEQLSRSSGFTRGVLLSMKSIAKVYIDQALYDSSLFYYKGALDYAGKQTLKDTAILITLYGNIAAIHVHWGQYQEALGFQYKAMNLAAKANNYKLSCLNYNNLGSILYELGQSEKAFYYLDKSKDIAFRKKEAGYVLPYIYLNEALLFFKNKEKEACKEKCRLALEANKQNRSVEVQYNATDLMGNIYKQEQKPEQAIACFKSILSIKEEYPAGKIQALISLGGIYLEQEDYQLAETYLLEAARRASALKGKRELKRIYEYLSNLYRARKQYPESIAYLDSLILVKDSLLDMEKIRSVSLLEVKYQTAQKDKEIAENKLFIAGQRAKIVKKNTLIYGISAGVLLITIAFLFSYFNWKRLQKQRQESLIWRAMAEGEEKERSRIARDLHDGIGGLLSTLKMYFGIMKKRVPELALLDVYQDASALLDNTVGEVRKTAHNLMPELLLKHGLPEAVRIFCDAIQDDEGLKIDFQYYGFIGQLNSGFQLSIYRIIQELVQNILKHAKATQALVQLSQHNDVLDITVEDNGIGMAGDMESNSGLGLNGIRRRVAELNGTFHISSAEGNGTTIYIEFNLLQQKNSAS